MSDFFAVQDEGIVLRILVQPRASKNEIAGIQDGELKIRLTSPPVEGAANALCRKFMAKVLGTAKSNITLLGGEKSRHKRLLIATDQTQPLCRRLRELAAAKA